MTLQIIVEIVYYDLNIPANVELYLREIGRIVRFELLNPEKLIQMKYPDFTIKGFMNEFKNKDKLVINPDADNSMIDEMIVYIFAFTMFSIFLSVLLMLTCIPKFRDLAKDKINDLKKQMMWNNAIKSLNVSWLKTSITGGKQIRLALAGSRTVEAG